jgi:hypothetical protein
MTTQPRQIEVPLPYATFRLVVAEGLVTQAPGAEWAAGRDEQAVAAYFRRRGAVIRVLGDNDENAAAA